MSRALTVIFGGLILWWMLADRETDDGPADAASPSVDESTPPADTAMRSYTRKDLEGIAIESAIAQGATPAILLAHCDIETAGWDSQAANLTGGDMKRGGAYGCPQITLRTARAVDDRIRTAWRDVDPERGGRALLDHPELALVLAAAVVAENESRTRADGGRLADVASLYNSGKPFAAAPATTKAYVDRFLRAYERRTGSREWS